MSKTKTETPVLRNSADIPWEEARLYLPADKTEEENQSSLRTPQERDRRRPPGG